MIIGSKSVPSLVRPGNANTAPMSSMQKLMPALPTVVILIAGLVRCVSVQALQYDDTSWDAATAFRRSDELGITKCSLPVGGHLDRILVAAAAGSFSLRAGLGVPAQSNLNRR